MFNKSKSFRLFDLFGAYMSTWFYQIVTRKSLHSTYSMETLTPCIDTYDEKIYDANLCWLVTYLKACQTTLMNEFHFQHTCPCMKSLNLISELGLEQRNLSYSCLSEHTKSTFYMKVLECCSTLCTNVLQHESFIKSNTFM